MLTFEEIQEKIFYLKKSEVSLRIRTVFTAYQYWFYTGRVEISDSDLLIFVGWFEAGRGHGIMKRFVPEVDKDLVRAVQDAVDLVISEGKLSL